MFCTFHQSKLKANNPSPSLGTQCALNSREEKRACCVCDNLYNVHIITILHHESERNSLGGTGGAESFGRQNERVMYAWLRKIEIENVEKEWGRHTIGVFGCKKD